MRTVLLDSYLLSQADIDAGKANSLPAGSPIFVIDGNSVPTGKEYRSTGSSTPTEAVTGNNINTVLSAAGGAGWAKIQATTPNYVITRPVSGAGLDLHIEAGSLAAITAVSWPIPATGVDQLRIRNFSGQAQNFTAGSGWTIVTADGNPVTSGSYSIPDDRAVEITLDPNGFAQVVPWGGEVSAATFNTHTANISNPHSVTKSQVQLGNADNVSDANKPVSTAQQTVFDTKEAKVTGKGLSTNDYTTVEKNKLAGVAVSATQNDTDANLKARANHTGTQAQSTVDNLTTDLAGKSATTHNHDTAYTAIAHGTNTSNPHSVTKTQVGLSNAENTTDLLKVVSTATQAALDAKQATLVSGNTIKTINGTPVLGSGDIVIAPTTVSSTVPTHNLDLVSDNYAGRALHLRPNGMTATANLATWSDSSGNGRDMAQATASLQPDVVENVLNGLPVVRFDGVDDFMANTSYPAPTALSIFVVFKSTVSNRGILTINSAASVGVVYLTNGEGTGDKFGVYLAGAVPTGWLSHPTSVTNLWTIAGVTVSTTSLDVYVNGVVTPRVLTTAASLAGIARIDIGRRIDGLVYHTGDIAEVVVFPTALNTTERQKVEGHLAAKFGLQASLPADHPYKTNPPQVGDLQTHADNAAATTAGLTVGAVYMSADGLLRVRF